MFTKEGSLKGEKLRAGLPRAEGVQGCPGHALILFFSFPHDLAPSLLSSFLFLLNFNGTVSMAEQNREERTLKGTEGRLPLKRVT